jgi:hypothetical protein
VFVYKTGASLPEVCVGWKAITGTHMEMTSQQRATTALGLQAHQPSFLCPTTCQGYMSSAEVCERRPLSIVACEFPPCTCHARPG